MKLCELLKTVEHVRIYGDVDREILYLTCYSKDIKEQSLFFAIEGYNDDGHKYIDEAIKNGAVALICEKLPKDIEQISKLMTIIEVKDARKAIAQCSCQFYNNPSENMQIIGVTGTKGKTTVTYMIRHILESAGIKTGIIGTVNIGYGSNMRKSNGTTPEPIELQQCLKEMADAGCKAVVMEVSSQGLMHNRVEGIDFNIGVFTNLSPDHIGENEHRDFEHYARCKSKLFEKCKRAVINGEDPNWPLVIKNSNHKQRIFFGKKKEFDFVYSDLTLLAKDGDFGVDFRIGAKKPFGDGIEHRIVLNTLGSFNADNAMAAIAVTRALGIPWETIIKALTEVSIPGRMEVVPLNKDFTVLLDYAHNGMALRKVLESLKEYDPGRLIVVFGCGGNRDKNRRYEMGKVAFELADFIIVTSDNPRKEKPEEIINDITSVMNFCEKTILVIPDRKKAIERALIEGRSGDIIIIAGKGHETYQIIGDDVIYFDDKQAVLSCGKD